MQSPDQVIVEFGCGSGFHTWHPLVGSLVQRGGVDFSSATAWLEIIEAAPIAMADIRTEREKIGIAFAPRIVRSQARFCFRYCNRKINGKSAKAILDVRAGGALSHRRDRGLAALTGYVWGGFADPITHLSPRRSGCAATAGVHGRTAGWWQIGSRLKAGMTIAKDRWKFRITSRDSDLERFQLSRIGSSPSGISSGPLRR